MLAGIAGRSLTLSRLSFRTMMPSLQCHAMPSRTSLHLRKSPQQYHSHHPPTPSFPSSPPKSIKPLISIPNKRQTERTLLATSARHPRLCLRPQLRRVVHLRDLVDGEVLRVDVTLQLRLEGGADLAQTLPLHAVEEGVVPQFRSAVHAAESVLGVAD